MRISDWSSDVCSSDLHPNEPQHEPTGTRSPVQRLRRSVISQAPLHLLAPPLSRKFSGSAQPLRHRIGIGKERGPRPQRFPRKTEPVLAIGSASGREGGCEYGKMSVAGGDLKKKKR